MKYAVEMGSCAMIYITKAHKDWLNHSKVSRGFTHTHSKDIA
jgi:hypothetical protein